MTAVAWQSEARWLVTASEDGTLKIWDPRIPKSPQRNFDHKSPVNDCVIHPNQGELVSCDQSGAVKIWDLGGRSLTHELVSSLWLENIGGAQAVFVQLFDSVSMPPMHSLRCRKTMYR